MRRVAVTGLGVVSCIGSSANEVLASLREGRSGITRNAAQVEHGFKSQVAGDPLLDPEGVVDKRTLRFMGDGAAWCWLAMDQAIRDAGLEASEVSHERSGLVVGTGGPSTRAIVAAADAVREKGSPRRIGPFAVPKAMSSTASATLATDFKIKGVSFSISSACTTSLHCIGEAADMIRHGRQDVMFAGGGEELDWTLSALFDAMGAMSSRYNETPERASRAFDVNRDGFVIAGGAGIVVLEDLERAKSRGARIYAEVVGYGATSDGHDMVQPSGEGAARAMRLAMAGLEGRTIDYINPHATSTPVGDIKEIEAIRDVFGDGSSQPLISATKSMTGHSLGAAGVQETIYSILMMQNGFVAPSINVEEMDPAIAGANIATALKDGLDLELVMSNSFGFGGTNGSLVLAKI
jgi:3-oxoacyl-[acyl-carrier-protein] synthase-1